MKKGSIFDHLLGVSSIRGNTEYLNSPFVAAGDRTYVVGHQDGSFPPLGWHVKDEMGGIWIHPIKIMDGYGLTIKAGENQWALNKAYEFYNYPFGNLHRFRNEALELEVERFQFVPDGLNGLIVSYQIRNLGNQPQKIELETNSQFDLKPVWLAEDKGIEDGKDSLIWVNELSAWLAVDQKNSWYALSTTDETQGTSYSKKDLNGVISKSLTINQKDSYTFQQLISGSYNSQDEAIATLSQLNSYEELLLSKKNRLGVLESTTQLKSSDQGLNEMFTWIKYNTDWLIRDVPELGRGMSAGIPDYPWWFGTDNGYILQGLASAGMHQEALSTIDLIIKLSESKNGQSGQIMHEASTNGIVFNPGNLNTTPTFIIALWDVYRWTGDSQILDKYFDHVIAGIQWIEEQDHDGNGFPDGPGMMEIPGLHTEMIDVVSYQAGAYKAAANFAMVKGKPNLAHVFNQKAEALRTKINTDWWVEEFNSFADFRATEKQALNLVDAAIVRADTIDKPWSVEELKITRQKIIDQRQTGTRGFVVHHNWVVNTPMEMGLADLEKANLALTTARTYENRFGMFVTGIDRNESQEKAEKWKAFSYVGAVMTLPTGVQAIGAAEYGQINLTLTYLKKLQNSFSYALPGSMYEVSPDFGMIAQGWNIYAVAVPVVNYIFGFNPKAHQKQLTIEPNIPDSWDTGTLSDVVVGDNIINVSFARQGGVVEFKIDQKLDWDITFSAKYLPALHVNGKQVESGNVLVLK